MDFRHGKGAASPRIFGMGNASAGTAPVASLPACAPACPLAFPRSGRERFSSGRAKASRLSDANDVKELRVKIDVSYHLKLHALKLLRNKKMSDAIEEALDYYFEHVVQAGPDLADADADAQARRLF